MTISLVDIAILCFISILVIFKVVPHSQDAVNYRITRLSAIFSLFLAVALFIIKKHIFANDIPVDSFYFAFSVLSHMFITYIYCYYLFYDLLPFALKGPLRSFGDGISRIQKNHLLCNLIILAYVFLIHIGHIGAIAIWGLTKVI